MWIDDKILETCEKNISLNIWQPEKSMIVLGSGNKPELECNIENCTDDKIEVKKRCGGGGTVLLHKGCVIISFGCWVKDPYKNDFYFQKLNQSVIKTLASKWDIFSELTQEGISDIAYHQKKICGTSLFRSRNYLLFQASILVEDHSSEISKYLVHPTKEPNYREGKSHSDFLSCLSSINSDATVENITELFKENLSNSFVSELKEELIDSEKKQIKHILKRAQRGILEESDSF